MTTQELLPRHNRAHHLKVVQVDDRNFLVESSAGKIAYKVLVLDGQPVCTCGDYMSNIRRDPSFRCKHILAVLNGNGNRLHASAPENGRKPKLDERFLTSIQGKDFVLYAGLLDLAHQKGLHKLSVEALQFPQKDNGQEAVCKAVVESKDGAVFVEWGDANPHNTNKKVVMHILRMAATRAKARALRDFTNIGITCLEELGDLDEVVGAPVEAPKKPRRKVTAINPVPDPVPAENKPSPLRPSEAQMRAIDNLAKRRNLNPEDLEEMAQQYYGTSFNNITATEASGFIQLLQQSA